MTGPDPREDRPGMKWKLKTTISAALVPALRDRRRPGTYLRHGITVGPGDVVIDAGRERRGGRGLLPRRVRSGRGSELRAGPGDPRDARRRTSTRFPGGRTWMAGLSDAEGTAEFTYYERRGRNVQPVRGSGAATRTRSSGPGRPGVSRGRSRRPVPKEPSTRGGHLRTRDPVRGDRRPRGSSGSTC